jgi:hypothetical protein
MNNMTIPAIYGSLCDTGFNLTNIFVKENDKWYLKFTTVKQQSDYDMYIMNENRMCKHLPVEHEYKDQDACLLYFESDQRQTVFDQESWLLVNEFELFSKSNKIWYKLGKRKELDKLRTSLAGPIFLKVKELWVQNLGSFKDYVTWGTLLATALAPVEHTVVYIASKKRFRFETQEEFEDDAKFWLSLLETEQERKKAISLLKELGVELE